MLGSMSLQRLAPIALLVVLALPDPARRLIDQAATPPRVATSGNRTLTEIAQTRARLDELQLTHPESAAAVAARQKLAVLLKRRAEEVASVKSGSGFVCVDQLGCRRIYRAQPQDPGPRRT
jgi:hypothetical protein